MAEPFHTNPTILRRNQVEVRTGLSRSTIYDRIKAGNFPKPIRLGTQSVGWLEADVNNWIASRIAESDVGEACTQRRCA